MSRAAALRGDSLDQTGTSEPDAIKRVQQFLTDLTDISAKHGIGISGDAVLFVLEPEDYSARYVIDDESNLQRA